MIQQRLLCTWRKETVAGMYDDDASNGKNVPIQDGGKMCGQCDVVPFVVAVWAINSLDDGAECLADS